MTDIFDYQVSWDAKLGGRLHQAFSSKEEAVVFADTGKLGYVNIVERKTHSGCVPMTTSRELFRGCHDGEWGSVGSTPWEGYPDHHAVSSL